MTILGIVGKYHRKNTMVLCRCICGTTKIVKIGQILHGDIVSCGCKKREIKNTFKVLGKTHGLSRTRLYSTWCNMRNRCLSPRYRQYYDYGGRGISICDEWVNDFLAFRDWALRSGYDDSLTIERIDADGDYCPENCTWIPRHDQSANRRNVILYNGVPACKIAELNGISKTVMHSRLNYGWTLEEAIGIVPRKYPANWQTRAKRPGPCRRSLPKND